MRKRIFLAISLCLIVLLIPGLAAARQEGATLNLGLTRNFGYGGLGKIQGRFTLRVVDPPEDLDEVSFYLDSELMEVVSEPPFQFQFHTSDYQGGDHQMIAEGILEDGTPVKSNTITKTFLTSDQAWGETQQIILPLLLGVGLLTLLGMGAPFLFGRKKGHVPGSYGPAGGAVCPRCALPFSRSFFAPNMMVGKLVRCPHCGKISILPRASANQLKEAEERYAGDGNAQAAAEGEEDIRKMIDDSRFTD